MSFTNPECDMRNRIEGRKFPPEDENRATPIEVE